ncbi:hypothetical protein BO94DRAFT_621581 [Aspergillus sclerotioniger CBS 115572]|uniref:F-box domain-containing protein n=1 Tax=Aspergillus sclerotioniger CBS 115572 TaxID=1450535 RepID=A0A317XC77_9EURO|nr:hypothetical protein BO94DRAFT_621581 [Aspergillus sclerotioniger CBS 115572]PWY94140.1 hypothetical protein BO94DRAFT_621581 [Aspergillus sclerotioniger CBS 115572]
MAAVNRNMFDASVTTDRPQGAPLMVLPLNLIAVIVSYVDDPGDLARLCRTCRVLNYMALPQLYKHITLTSYDKIRYRDEEPEGMGSASPFSMGLNAIITRPYATLVRSLTLRGNWRELELEEHARVGRVPDSSMMLNIAVRAAVDKMTELESFSWELNTKMLETVYVGLARLPKLTALTLRFPSSRHPRPTIVIPPMPHLRYLKITDIDPLCYPDDISTLLWKCRKLRELNMHWSPRMRNAQEPSVMVHDYFRKCIAAKQPLSIKKLGLQNLYALHTEDFNRAVDNSTVEEVTVLNNSGAELSMNTFVDSTWPSAPVFRIRIKSMRQDAVSRKHADFLNNFTGLERLYFVNATLNPNDDINSPRPLTSNTVLTPPASDLSRSASNGSFTTCSNSPSLHASTRDLYLNNITMNHAATLRHLLLPARWPLSAPTVARLVHASPQLEQLGFATEFSDLEALGLLLPFLRNLKALRLLIPTNSTPSDAGRGPPPAKTLKYSSQSANALGSALTISDLVDADDEILIARLSESLADQQVFHRLKIIGLGRKGFQLGDYYTVSAEQPDSHGQVQLQTPTGSRATSAEANVGYEKSPAAEVPFTPANGHTAVVPSQTNGHPPSLLGKRAREDDSPATEQGEAKQNPDEESMEQRLNNPCVPQLLRDGRFWRRRVRRVGWEVLKHWEIWGLDKQEL